MFVQFLTSKNMSIYLLSKVKKSSTLGRLSKPNLERKTVKRKIFYIITFWVRGKI